MIFTVMFGYVYLLQQNLDRINLHKQEIAMNYLTTEDFQCQDVQFIYFLTLTVIGHTVNEK